MDQPNRQWDSVQALRAIAATFVVLAHAIAVATEGMARGGAAPSVLVGGDFVYLVVFGVDLLFVISGFIIMDVSWDRFAKRSALPTFAIKRFNRILPLYWFYLTLACIFFFVVDSVAPNALELPELSAETIAYSFLLFTGTPVVVPGWKDALFPPFYNPIFSVSWAILVQLYFYFVFLLCMAVNRKFLAPTLAIVFSVGVFALGVYVDDHRLLWVVADSVLYEFLIGVLACYVVRMGFPRASAIALLLVVIGVVCVAVSPLFTDVFIRPVSWGIPAAMMIIGLVSLERNRGSFVPGWLRAIGNSSYTLFLMHLTFMLMIEVILTETGLWPVLGGDIYLTFVVFGSIGLGLAAYAYIERPLLTALSWRTLRQGPSVLSTDNEARHLKVGE